MRVGGSAGHGRCPARADASPPLRRGHLRLSNESRTKNHDKPDLYANYCFVMARAVTQFHRFARFDPAAPRLSPQAYTQRVEQVTAYSHGTTPPRRPACGDSRLRLSPRALGEQERS